MSKKFWFLTKMSFFKKVRNKTFIIVNILLCILVIGISNIDSIIKYFGGDFNDTNSIMVVDNSNESYELIKANIKSSTSILDNDVNYKIKKYDSEIEVSKKIKDDNYIGVIINKDENNILNARIITYGYINKSLYQLIENSINNIKKSLALNELNISQEEFSKMNSNVQIKRQYIDKDKNENEENKEFIMNVVFPIMILPFFMLTLLIIQMIGAEINEEKSTRSMEVIISNVPANIHFFSKILAANLFVLLQSLILLIDGYIGIKIRGTMLNSSVMDTVKDVINGTDIVGSIINVLPYTLVIMVITIICYSLLAGILASVTTNMEDFQQMQSPIIIILMIGFYLSLMSSMFNGSVFIRVLSYIPFISSILSPCLLISGVIGIKDIILSILLMVVVLYLLIKYGMKIYKEGILNYTSSNLWKKIFKAIKN